VTARGQICFTAHAPHQLRVRARQKDTIHRYTPVLDSLFFPVRLNCHKLKLALFPTASKYIPAAEHPLESYARLIGEMEE